MTAPSSIAALALAGVLAGALPAHAEPLQLKTTPVRFTEAQLAAAMKASGGTQPSLDGWASGDIRLPTVTGGAPGVAARIESALWYGEAEQPPPAAGTPPRVVPETATQGLSSLAFRLARADARVVSVEVDAEGCGAYCESSSTHRLFDARDGHAIALEELFTPAGLVDALRRAGQARRAAYAEAAKPAPADPQHPPTAEDRDDAEQRVALARECLASETKRDAASLRTIIVDVDLPATGGLVLGSARCSNHAMQALDDVGEASYTIAAKDAAPLLAPYGRWLLLGEAPVPSPATVVGQALHGTVGDAPVTLWLPRPENDGSLRTHYAYDRHRRPIELLGQVHGQRVELHEGEGAAAATFTLTAQGTSLAGEWTSRGKTLPVHLAW